MLARGGHQLQPEVFEVDRPRATRQVSKAFDALTFPGFGFLRPLPSVMYFSSL